MTNNQCKKEKKLKYDPSVTYHCLKRQGHKGGHKFDFTF